MMPLIFGTQLIVGTLLLANRFVPLTLALLAAFVVNSVAFHAFLERSGLPVAFAVLALEVYLPWVYRKGVPLHARPENHTLISSFRGTRA